MICEKYFITFASENFIEAGNRLTNQANGIGVFDKIIFYSEKYLKVDNLFWDKHATFIENNKRGYGYWLWKPYLIQKTMKSMKDGDILLYLDSGCEIDINKKEQMLINFDIVKNDYILISKCSYEIEFNKMDLVMKLDMNNPIYLNSFQHQAGAILFLVCDKTRKLVDEWYELGCDYKNIDDTPSINNYSWFIEHRHDQAIFSLLTKKYNLYSKQHDITSSVEYIRNNTGISRLHR